MENEIWRQLPWNRFNSTEVSSTEMKLVCLQNCLGHRNDTILLANLSRTQKWHWFVCINVLDREIIEICQLNCLGLQNDTGLLAQSTKTQMWCQCACRDVSVAKVTSLYLPYRPRRRSGTGLFPETYQTQKWDQFVATIRPVDPVKVLLPHRHRYSPCWKKHAREKRQKIMLSKRLLYYIVMGRM